MTSGAANPPPKTVTVTRVWSFAAEESRVTAVVRLNPGACAIVGCAVAASMEGSVLFGTDAKVVARPRVKLSAIRKGGR